MSRFLRDFSKLGLDEECRKEKKSHRKNIVVAQRMRWVIVDKENFNKLINDLAYFNGRLSALVPDAPESHLGEQDLAHLRSIAELEMIAKASSESRPAVTIAAKRAIIQVRILQHLWFRWMDDRRANVQKAHFQTLRWALDPPANAINKWDNLNTWLQKSSGIYWLAGKAGSGKSTLMKYLLGHERMQELLQLWAGKSQLTVVNFFFYHLGCPEQKSQAGLLRSILWQILDKHPTAIEAILPNMWREAQDSQTERLTIPSIAEMRDALMTFCTTHLGNEKLFLMIDGIDEYEGKDLDVANFIQDLDSITNTKILVSSRPHPAFFVAFSQRPKMNLPDLTRDDIIAYINDVVAFHPHMITLSEIEPEGPMKIIEELVSKASGVFLWVVLACRSIVEGRIAYDTISDIKARVAELPKEVEDLFEHMLSKIEPRWREETAKLLRLVYVNQSLNGIDPIPTLGLQLVYEQGLQPCYRPKKYALLPRNRGSNLAKCQVMEGRLRSRCCGLLEVQKANGSLPNHQFCACRGVGQCHDQDLDSHIVFMHRTVYEFLSIPDMWQRDLMSIQDATFNSYTTLSSLWVQLAATVDMRSEVLENCISHALIYAYHGDQSGCSPEFTVATLSKAQFVSGLSSSLFSSIPLWLRAKECLRHSHYCQRYCDDFSLGLALAVELGATQVVQFAFEQRQCLPDLLVHAAEHAKYANYFFDCKNRQSGWDDSLKHWQKSCRASPTENKILETLHPILYHAGSRPLLQSLAAQNSAMKQFLEEKQHLEMIQHLLEKAHDPNEKFSKAGARDETPLTPWIEWIRFHDTPDESSTQSKKETAEITRLFLMSGAVVPCPGTEDFSRLKRITLGSTTSSSRKASHPILNPDEDGEWVQVRNTIESRLQIRYGESAVTKFRDTAYDTELKTDSEALDPDKNDATKAIKRSFPTAISVTSSNPHSMKRPKLHDATLVEPRVIYFPNTGRSSGFMARDSPTEGSANCLP